ncbi:hypothetical protein GA0111570_10144 [Raineyella antarctica]|uniref:Uncharacterized protein n=1 Tax=Raineyella antarctica TaxID=1577474 RepID=A0A1G6GDG8_9ACTN|nr:hypothetical protein GA0111570_10144 [Raineyella antarctica]
MRLMAVGMSVGFSLIGLGAVGTAHAATPADAAVQETTTAVEGPVQEIVSTVTGTMGNNGWYTSDVTVAWSFTDPKVAANVVEGTCENRTLSYDTIGETFTCVLTTSWGVALSKSVTIRRDATAPVLAVGRPDPIVLHDSVTADTSASDATSGVDTAGCDPVLTSTVGYSTLTCTAVDLAGNQASAGMRYPVVAPFGSFTAPLLSTAAVRSGSQIRVMFTLRDVNGSLSQADAQTLASNGQVRVVLTATADGSGEPLASALCKWDKRASAFACAPRTPKLDAASITNPYFITVQETGPGQDDWFAAPNLDGAAGEPGNSLPVELR